MKPQLNRYSNYVFNRNKIARNRVIIPPMASQTADTDGFVTPATIEHYRRLSLAQAGLIFVEYSYVHRSGKGEANQLGVDSDEKIQGLSEISKVIHDSGSLAALQLVHVGGKTTAKLTGSSLMAPSSIAVPVKGWTPEKPLAMTETQIENWVQWFTNAAVRAYQAGFDFVELHAAHGYGLNQWLSPITNQRQDLFGGSLQNRSRLLLNIVKKIKAVVPDLLIAVRLPAQDHISEGLNFNDMSCIVRLLQNAGVDLIDVSSGIGGWKRPDGRSGEGYLVDDAALLKSEILIPVIGVGGIETGKFIDDIIKNKKVDFAAVGRAILKDPNHWSLSQLPENH
jgi:NADPH2 dehydrogenase